MAGSFMSQRDMSFLRYWEAVDNRQRNAQGLLTEPTAAEAIRTLQQRKVRPNKNWKNDPPISMEELREKLKQMENSPS